MSGCDIVQQFCASEFWFEVQPEAHLEIKPPLRVLPPLETAWGGFLGKLQLLKVLGGIGVLSASLASLPNILGKASDRNPVQVA